MKTLTEVLPDVDQLSEEEQAGLVAHLLANLRGAPLGRDDKELARREAEIDAGTAELITFDELEKRHAITSPAAGAGFSRVRPRSRCAGPRL